MRSACRGLNAICADLQAFGGKVLFARGILNLEDISRAFASRRKMLLLLAIMQNVSTSLKEAEGASRSSQELYLWLRQRYFYINEHLSGQIHIMYGVGALATKRDLIESSL